MTIGQNLKFEDDFENINAIMLTSKQKVFITVRQKVGHHREGGDVILFKCGDNGVYSLL